MSRVAIIQMNSSQEVAPNLRFVEDAMKLARDSGACMAFLPENFAALGTTRARDIARDEATPRGPIRSCLAGLARSTGLWIQAGTIPLPFRPDGSPVPGDRLRAASIVYDASGNEAARYDKMHMFDVVVADSHRNYRESETYEAGNELCVVDTPIGRLGLTVCYDIRFPELYRALLHLGATAFSIPSAFTRPTGEAHWNALVRARAIENLAHVIGACQWGEHDSGRQTWGESMVVDPWGMVLDVHSHGTGVSVVDIRPERALEARRDMPIHTQTRLEIRVSGQSKVSSVQQAG